MTVRERLQEIQDLLTMRLYHAADKKWDALYNDWALNLSMSADEEEWMFCLMSRLQRVLHKGYI